MAEEIVTVPGVVAVAVSALNSSTALSNVIKEYSYHPKRIRDLLEELDALGHTLRQITQTAITTTSIDLSVIRLPLLKCDEACKAFETDIKKWMSRTDGDRITFRGWAKLNYVRDDIDRFKEMLAGYKATFSICLAAKCLENHNTATIEILEDYRAQIKTTTDVLEDHLKDIIEKLDAVVTRTAGKPMSNTEELLQMEKERSSTQNCLQICDQFSEYMEQVQLKAKIKQISKPETSPTNHHDQPDHVELQSIIANGSESGSVSVADSGYMSMEGGQGAFAEQVATLLLTRIEFEEALQQASTAMRPLQLQHALDRLLKCFADRLTDNSGDLFRTNAKRFISQRSKDIARALWDRVAEPDIKEKAPADTDVRDTVKNRVEEYLRDMRARLGETSTFTSPNFEELSIQLPKNDESEAQNDQVQEDTDVHFPSLEIVKTYLVEGLAMYELVRRLGYIGRDLPLHFAAYDDDHIGTRDLLDGAMGIPVEINTLDSQGRTALSIALEHHHFHLAAELLQHGSKMSVCWNAEDAALHDALHEQWMAARSINDCEVFLTLLDAIPTGSRISPKSTLGPQPTVLFIRIEWAVPDFILGMRSASGHGQYHAVTDTYNLIYNSTVITGFEYSYTITTCGEFVLNSWGSLGLSALLLVSEFAQYSVNRDRKAASIALEPRFKMHHVRKNEIGFAADFKHESEKWRFIEALAWICGAIRPLPIQGADKAGLCALHKSEMLSTHEILRQGHHYLHVRMNCLKRLDHLEVGPAHCWVSLFESIILVMSSTQRRKTPGLEIPFEMMVDLTAAQNFTRVATTRKCKDQIKIEHCSGFILIGFYTAIIPVSKDSDGIYWHLICSETIIDPHNLVLPTDWLHSQDIETLRKSKCFLGWGDLANILLGTRHIEYTVGWSGAKKCEKVLERDGYAGQFELGFGEGLPISAKVALEKQWRYRNVIVRYEPHSQYSKAIQELSQHVALVFDRTDQRAWLVPLLSLLLHLCHVYFSHFNENTLKSDPIPFAEPSTDGSRAALAALKGSGDLHVFEDVTLANVLLDIHGNMQRSSRAMVDGKILFAGEAMDHILQPGSGSILRTEKLGSPSNEWLGLVKLVDSVSFCGGLGEAMQLVVPDLMQQCTCLQLPKNRYLLGAHNWCLEQVLKRQGSSLTSLAIGDCKIGEKVWLSVRQWPFTCHHDPQKSFWGEDARSLQCISKQPKHFSNASNLELASLPPLTGALAFGTPKPRYLEKRKPIEQSIFTRWIGRSNR
ncbi:hypothetical protein BX600DRAFT_475659 [Xylariales sp. PMI_506]|nr:hypothetical protein BX600DRAFT_475659 [Xylariales sp. PMI_506]